MAVQKSRVSKFKKGLKLRVSLSFNFKKKLKYNYNFFLKKNNF